MKNIVLGITGSIAAYKAADLCSKLSQLGHQVHVVMTPNATEFITPLTLQALCGNPVLVNLSDEKSGQIGHIELADNADLIIIAPASANCIAGLAQGLAQDSLGSVYLASKAPVVIAPAMNGKMWEHPATKRNVEILKQDGCTFLGPETSGRLACGYEGAGRLLDPQVIIDELGKWL